jgi:tetratricopeptide (TPR) repeat protein
MYEGKPGEALEVLQEARSLVEGEGFDDVDRAELMYRLGCCRYRLASIPTATALFDQALELAERGKRPCDQLRAHIFEASLVAEREGRFELARDYAESARARYEELADRVNVGRLMNNLGGLSFLLGDVDAALEQLQTAFEIALEASSEVDAGYVVSSLAQVRLRRGEYELAERSAGEALGLLGERADVIDEISNAQLVLSRAIMQQGRLDEAERVLETAERAMADSASTSHRAAVWVAQGDLDARRGRHERAAEVYRRAAESLQDFHF